MGFNGEKDQASFQNAAAEVRMGLRSLDGSNKKVKAITTFVNSGLEKAERDKEGSEDTLFESCLWYGYARILSGDTHNINYQSGIVISPTQKHDLDTLTQLRDSYIKGVEKQKKLFAEVFKESFIDVLGIQAHSTAFLMGISPSNFTEEQQDMIWEIVEMNLEPDPIFVPFDYFEDGLFVRDFCRFPQGLNRPSFAYMKASGSPPFIWYSNRRENDYPSYSEEQSKKMGIPNEERIRITGQHEVTHELVLDPILRVVMTSDPHSPLSEFMAQYAGEPIDTVWDKVKPLVRKEEYVVEPGTDFVKEMFGTGGVNYEKALLYFIPFSQIVDLSSHFDSNAPNRMNPLRGVGTMYHRLIDYFYEVINKRAPRLDSFEDLALKVILPLIPRDAINTIMYEQTQRFWGRVLETDKRLSSPKANDVLNDLNFLIKKAYSCKIAP